MVFTPQGIDCLEDSGARGDPAFQPAFAWDIEQGDAKQDAENALPRREKHDQASDQQQCSQQVLGCDGGNSEGRMRLLQKGLRRSVMCEIVGRDADDNVGQRNSCPNNHDQGKTDDCPHDALMLAEPIGCEVENCQQH